MHVRYNCSSCGNLCSRLVKGIMFNSVVEPIVGQLASIEIPNLDESLTHVLDMNNTMYLGGDLYKLLFVVLLHRGFVRLPRCRSFVCPDLFLRLREFLSLEPSNGSQPRNLPHANVQVSWRMELWHPYGLQPHLTCHLTASVAVTSEKLAVGFSSTTNFRFSILFDEGNILRQLLYCSKSYAKVSALI